MKEKILSSVLFPGFILVLAVSLTSCASSKHSAQNKKNSNTVVPEKKNGTDYSGTYAITDPSVCNLIVVVTKIDSGYIYTLNVAGVKSSGKLKVEKDNGQVYLNFTATLRSGDRIPVTGMYSDNAIIIQNYGNAMNPYICFKACDVRHLELVKDR